MNLAEMLCYADIDQLTRIARNYDCHGGSHSKHELIQSVLAAICRQDSLESRMEQMSADELRFLNSLLFEERRAYSMEELKAQASGKPPPKLTAGIVGSGKALAERPEAPVDPARQAIVRFRQYGWLFNGFSHQTRYLYQVPDDVKRALRHALDRKFRPRLAIREEPPVYRDEGNLLIEDLETFVRYVRDNDVQLAADGVIYKRQLLQLLALMSVREEPPDKSGEWRFGYGRRFPDYPDRFSLLFDYAWKLGLVREHPDRLIVTEAGRDLAEGRQRVDAAELYRFWLRLYKSPIPNIAVLANWVVRLSVEWTTTASLFDILHPLIRPYYFDKEIDVLNRRVLTMMMHLGLLRSGMTPEGEFVVQTTQRWAQAHS